jgi:hypothetical protein
MGHPSSLSGKIHKGEAITAMSILTVLCSAAPPSIIDILASLAAPLSVQAFLRGDDAILVSHCLPCLAAMATGRTSPPDSLTVDLTPKCNSHQCHLLRIYWTKLIVHAPSPKACRRSPCVSGTMLETWCGDSKTCLYRLFYIFVFARVFSCFCYVIVLMQTARCRPRLWSICAFHPWPSFPHPPYPPHRESVGVPKTCGGLLPGSKAFARGSSCSLFREVPTLQFHWNCSRETQHFSCIMKHCACLSVTCTRSPGVTQYKSQMEVQYAA